MSNALAIATATQALALLIGDNLQPEIDLAVTVEPRRPLTEPTDDARITVFCYQVAPNAAQRGRDLPTRAPDGTVLTRPAAALDLHYLISAYGEEAGLVGQRLIGCVVRTLHEIPVLPRELIEKAADLPHLLGSDLAASPQRVRFTPLPMDVDETSKLWGMLHQTPYALSVTYQASLVLVEGRQTPVAGRPVGRRTVRAVPGLGPRLDQVRSRPQGSTAPPAEGPVPPGHELVVTGTGLKADQVTARVGARDIPVPPGRVTQDTAVVALPADLEPGPHALRLLHGIALGDPPAPHAGAQSGTVVFALQPAVDGEVDVADRVQGERVAATLTARLTAPVGDAQRAAFLLYEDAPPAGRPAWSHRFETGALTGRNDRHRVTVRATGVRPARYRAAVEIDGVPSPADPATGQGPLVDLTAPAPEAAGGPPPG